MKPTIINKPHLLMSCLIFAFVFPSPNQAVTDAELEALEKQIKEQEAAQQAEEKKKIELDAKRKAESEAKKKQRIELEKQKKQEALERKKQEEELEAQRLLEEERLRKEKEARLKAEQEKKAQYDSHINLAETYLAKDEFEKAISEFQIVLDTFPNDVRAMEGLKKAEAYLTACNGIVGEWLVAPNGINWKIHENNTVFGTWLIFSANGFWECVDPRKREVVVSWPDCAVCFTEYFYISEDNNTLNPTRGSGSLGRRIDGSEQERKASQPEIKL